MKPNTGRILAVIMGLAVGLRAYAITAPALSYDESGSFMMAQLPVEQLIAATAHDVHPPLYILLQAVVYRIVGPSDMSARLPSAIYSVVSVMLWYLACRSMRLSAFTSALSMLLMAVMPFQIAYGQESRMYALLELEVIAGILAIASGRGWLYLLSCAAMVYTHNWGLVYVAALFALGLTAAAAGRGELKVRLVTGTVVAIAAWIPWAIVMVSQMADYRADWIQPVNAGSLLLMIYQVFWMASLPHLAILAFGATWILLAAGLVACWKRGQFYPLSLVVMVTAVLAIGIMVSIAWRPMMIPRVLIGIAPILYTWIAQACEMLGVKWSRLLAVPALPLVLTGVLFVYPSQVHIKDEGRDMAMQLQLRPGEIVYHATIASWLPWRPYRTGDYMMPPELGAMGELSHDTLIAMEVPITPIQELDWRHAYLVAAMGPTTSAMTDSAVRALVERYDGRLLRTLGDGELIQGGVWYLTYDDGH